MTGAIIRSRALERVNFIDSLSATVDTETATAIFDSLNRIAMLRYEESTNSGHLVLCRPQSLQGLLGLRFEQPFPLTDLLGVRKMLEITDRYLCLLSDGRHIHGFTTLGQDDSESMVVQFHPHGMWELRQAGSVILHIYGSEDFSLSGTFDNDTFASALHTVFDRLTGAQSQRLWDLISAATLQLRGTNVLITKEAAAESKRLASQCTRIEPVPLSPMLMERLTSIDGTVIIDTQGVCHAIGAILDGPVTERGDRTRGGRYNSALMYVDSSPSPSMIVVVSQVGTIDLVFREHDSQVE